MPALSPAFRLPPMMKSRCALLLCAMLAACGEPRYEVDQGRLSAWVEDFKQEARSEGISVSLLEQAFDGFHPSRRIVELDRKQPEGTMSYAQYRSRVMPTGRIARGRELLREHAGELSRVSRRYGVPPQYIVALWGVETDYGRNMGSTPVVESLGTLAFDGRRSAFFRKELLTALRIAQESRIAPNRMKGSWAGAMGQTQFMPSSYKRFAVDADGSGRADIWNSLPDVFASIANYLSSEGWREDESWGTAVELPEGFSRGRADGKTLRSVGQWRAMGVMVPEEVANSHSAALVVPDKDREGPAYLAFHNYRVILKWNRSTYFATTVGLLADAIAGEEP